jgi:hypothetical protein
VFPVRYELNKFVARSITVAELSDVIRNDVILHNMK